MIYDNIKKGGYTFFSPFWDSISAEAKDLVSILLRYSPNKRCSAEEMLRHPWLRVCVVCVVCSTRACVCSVCVPV